MAENKNILIVGATGVVGLHLTRLLCNGTSGVTVFAATRNPEQAQKKLGSLPNLNFRTFDLSKKQTYAKALQHIHAVYLIRPPEVTRIRKYYNPFFVVAKKAGVQHIVFQSVQGANSNKLLPHHRIEQLLMQSDIPYTILRPTYFMQNLSTGLRQEIRQNHRLYVPAGKAVFNWLDAADFAHGAAHILLRPHDFRNTSLNLVGTENYTFKEVSELCSKAWGKKVIFKNAAIASFILAQIKSGMGVKRALIMAAAHYFARFAKPIKSGVTLEEITGQKPSSLFEYLNQNKSLTLQE